MSSYRHISSRALDPCEILGRVRDPKAGALVLFSGETRNHHEGQAVDHLEYEAQEEMAENMIAGIIAEAIQKWKLHAACAVHRVGRVDISEPAVVVATSASYRQEAYEANRYIIDRIKSEAPIWKREHPEEGAPRWQER